MGAGLHEIGEGRAMMPAVKLSKLGRSALMYAAQYGWRVFPLHSIDNGACTCADSKCTGTKPGKHPRTPNGCLDATTDTGAIRVWWERWPDANVGIATGGGLVVIDVDPRHGGDDGLVDLRARLGELPDTVECLTGSGGRHIYVSVGEGVVVRNSAGTLAPGVDIHVVSGIRGDGLEALLQYAKGYRTVALLGASGVGKSTIVNTLVGGQVQSTAAVREGDQRGRHTTTAVQLVALPSDPVGEAGWLIDTPGVRAVSLWSSGTGIERAFADVFTLSEKCRFRDCKHREEPGCAVSAAVIAGKLDPRRLDSMKRLVAEEAALEEEQKARLKVEDRRGFRKRKP